MLKNALPKVLVREIHLERDKTISKHLNDHVFIAEGFSLVRLLAKMS